MSFGGVFSSKIGFKEAIGDALTIVYQTLPVFYCEPRAYDVPGWWYIQAIIFHTITVSHELPNLVPIQAILSILLFDPIL